MADGRPIAAAVWMLGSVVAFTAMAVAAREVSATHDTFEVLMVRSVVGTLVDVGRGRKRPGEILGIIRARDRDLAGDLAPPQGLTLWTVRYPGWSSDAGRGEWPRP